MKNLFYLFAIIVLLSINSNIFAQKSDRINVKTHRSNSNTAVEKISEQDATARERMRLEKQKVQTADKKNNSVDFETLKKLKRDETTRKRGQVSSNAVQKNDRSFSSPNAAAYGKIATSTNKFSEAEIEATKQQKDAQETTKKIRLERKGMASSSPSIIKTSYTKESLRKSIAELEQKVFCAEENGNMKAAELEKLKSAISNREKLLKTLK